PFSLLLAIIGDQMEQSPFDEVTKTAPVTIGAVQIAMDDAKGELLEDLLGRFRIVEHAAQIALDRASVTVEQLLPGRERRIGGRLMGPIDKGPQSGNQAEPLIEAFRLHNSAPAAAWQR